jgi:CheY-like chemotaxis protein
MLNLLSNAGRFTEQGGVYVAARQNGEHIIVSVADTGPGIEAGARDELFRPFHQLDASVRKKYGGSGLGLSISKAIIEQHGGRIWFESSEGKGTTFFFSLPLNASDRAASDASRWFSPYLQHRERVRPSRAPVPAARPRFLVVDPGGSLQRLLARYLGEIEVVAVDSMREASQEIRHHPAHALIVNDVSLDPAFRSLDRADLIPHGIPVLVCAIPGAGEAADALGIADYLVKPVTRHRLLSALDRLCLQGDTLLIVDDEEDASRLFRRMLSSSGRGYRVLTAEDGQEAMRMLQEERPAAMLLDLVIPKMDGFQVLAEKSRAPELREIPTLVVSARDPIGQPVVSSAVVITQRDGLSASQLLRCIAEITATLAATYPSDDPTHPERRLVAPALV